MYPSFYRAVKLTLPKDIEELSQDGTIKTEMDQESRTGHWFSYNRGCFS